MSKIRPPRRPKGEDPKVTILNQDKQIKLLTDRIVRLDEALRASNKCATDNQDTARQWRDKAERLEKKLQESERLFLDAAREANYQNGYIARVKEEDGHRYGDLPK